ncbi:MAG: FkbM family methyltransferase [Gemmatimonadales bacterium]
MGIVATLRFVMRHPLNRGRKLGAAWRFLEWQLGSRLVPGPVIVGFVGTSRLIVTRGSTGATGNLYTGLGEFEEMGFLGHFLRPGDLFVDIGANIGAYTILAAGWIGADVIAVEPGPEAFERLCENVRLNGVANRVQTRRVAIGEHEGAAMLTQNLDTMNHLIPAGDSESGMSVDVVTLDGLLRDSSPVALKVDVEGFETAVFSRGEAVLAAPQLQAMVVEMNGSGKRFGYDETSLHRTILSHGFRHVRYDPVTRRIDAGDVQGAGDNRIYIRDSAELRSRLTSAPAIPLPFGRAL